MPIPMLTATRDLIGPTAANCESRALFADRFADPQAKDGKDATPRKDWFQKLIGKNASLQSPSQDWLPDRAETLHARLMSRMMVNLAGGVMENANLLFDRYGYPTIPGSAVKGCARRIALQALHDWIEAGSERPAGDDACAPCCEGFGKPADMLAVIARVFGWVKGDWDGGKNRDKKTGAETTWKSDFAWACNGDASLLADAKAIAGPHETFAGTVAFLAATPNIDPGIELDVLTPHHKEYYEGELTVATDTEDPVPVYFPTIKQQKDGDYFTFPLIPLRRIEAGDLARAKAWLATGLELFGLGAKTNAGYGWFANVTNAIESLLSKRQRVASAIKHHRDFSDWDNDQKDEAILLLADQPNLCRDWEEADSASFRLISIYAAQQGVTL